MYYYCYGNESNGLKKKEASVAKKLQKYWSSGLYNDHQIKILLHFDLK